MKKEINVFAYAAQITEAIGKGILLTTSLNGKVNTMAIGWGTLGIQWGKPIFIAFVRQSRYTKELLDQTGEFTINVPLEILDKEIIRVCGTKSGRDLDKVAALGLKTVPGDTVAAPGFAQLPLTLECKVIYRQDQDLQAICPQSLARYYAAGTADERDFHTAYYGEITAAYIIEECV